VFHKKVRRGEAGGLLAPGRAVSGLVSQRPQGQGIKHQGVDCARSARRLTWRCGAACGGLAAGRLLCQSSGAWTRLAAWEGAGPSGRAPRLGVGGGASPWLMTAVVPGGAGVCLVMAGSCLRHSGCGLPAAWQCSCPWSPLGPPFSLVDVQRYTPACCRPQMCRRGTRLPLFCAPAPCLPHRVPPLPPPPAGQDHQEDRAEAAVRRVQGHQHEAHQGGGHACLGGGGEWLGWK
jgi:hypothetical protein